MKCYALVQLQGFLIPFVPSCHNLNDFCSWKPDGWGYKECAPLCLLFLPVRSKDGPRNKWFFMISKDVVMLNLFLNVAYTFNIYMQGTRLWMERNWIWGLVFWSSTIALVLFEGASSRPFYLLFGCLQKCSWSSLEPILKKSWCHIVLSVGVKVKMVTF